jgi:urease accessory protein
MKRLLTAALLLGATPALAHHPLAGAPMATLSDGLLSGIGHPVLGFDHLFFVILAGIAGMIAGRPNAAPAAYVAAMLAGCALMVAGIGLPAKEVMIALSLLVTGGVVLAGRAQTPGMVLALFAGFGLFHGSAFGEAMTGVEGGAGGAVLAGYLVGLAAVQFAIAAAAGRIAATLLHTEEAGAINARIAGAVVAGAGLLLTLEAAEGAAFAALGWG